MTTPDAEMIRLALKGFEDARARVAAAPAIAAHHLYVPLTEATWWAICVDDALAKAPGYKSARNTSPEGQTVAGLNYARSALGHHWAFIAETGGGVRFPLRFPVRFETYARWVPVEDLPPFDAQPWARPHYVARVAGRRVLETLEDADAWFRKATA